MTETELQKLLTELLEEGESEFVEFKKNHYRDFDELGQYFSALSNGACLRNKDFGFLVFGIEDGTRASKGTKRTFEENGKSLELHFRTHIHPATKFEIHRFGYKEKPITLLQFTAAKGEPTTHNKISWGRVNSHLVDLRSEKYSDLIKKIYTSDTDWSAQIIDGATFEDLDPKAVKKACEKIRERRKNLADQKNQKILLDKARITVDGKITRAALILLGKQEAAHFLSPAQAEIIHRLIGWNLSPNEITSKAFHPPFLLTLDDVWKDIRNNKIKVFTNNSLFPDPIDKYDAEPILEALNNCIAHQDYSENKRVVLYEKPDRLIFESAGSFFDGKVEDYIEGAKTPKKYRNKFLANAMRELGIIDIEGSGINKIYRSQIRKFFPAPDYKTDNEVSVTIYGKIIDERFSQILMEKDLDLTTAVLLDHVQKGLPLSDVGAKFLKQQKLIEGRKPKYFVTAEVASAADQKEKYIKNRAFDKHHYKALILQFLSKYEEASRKEIDELLTDKLSEILSPEQKKKKIDNLLYEMASKDKSVKNRGSCRIPQWRKLGEN
jgi:ATP-dependent DNA helicase RecG